MSDHRVYEVCERLHAAAESCYQRESALAANTLALVPQRGQVELVLVLDNDLPATQLARDAAARADAVGAVFTGELWVDAVSTRAASAPHRPRAGRDRPAARGGVERREAIVTTAVQPGVAVRRLATVIERGTYGVTLRRVRMADPEPGSDALAVWLAAILPPPLAAARAKRAGRTGTRRGTGQPARRLRCPPAPGPWRALTALPARTNLQRVARRATSAARPR
jgi:hypothetical protein